MELFFSVLLLVMATVVANIIYSLFPRVPLAFYQIGAGFILSWLPQFNHFQLEPEIFFLVILAPLMFNEGQNTSYLSLRRHFKAIISLAIVLAILTIFIAGGLTSWLWPALPTALAMSLAAIVTPTDAVAVSSITANVQVPQNVMETLENESLFNDASGIVALNLAVAAFSTGAFSVTASVGRFIVVFLGGVLVGIILGGLLVLLQLFFQRHLFSVASVTLPVNLLAPFLVYLVAEELHLSGILAVVAAGIIHGIYQKQLRLTSTGNQVILSTGWTIVSQLLNGFVFVLLGVTLPRNMADLADFSNSHFSKLLVLAIGLYVVMTVLRLIWAQFNLVHVPAKTSQQHWRNSWVLALSGVHGTITLAMAFSLPLVVKTQLLPFRTDLIFIAEAVIVISLIVPTLILPRILPRKKNNFTTQQFNRTLSSMVDYAIQQLKAHYDQDYLTLSRVISLLNTQRGHREHASVKKISHLFQRTQSLEIAIINDYAHNGQVKWASAQRYELRQLFYLRRIMLRPGMRLKLGWDILWRLIKNNRQLLVKAYQLRKNKLPEPENYHQDAKKMENWGYHAVLKYLRRMRRSDNKAEIRILRHYYELRHQRFNRPAEETTDESELLIAAFQYEYSYLQQISQKQELPLDLIQALNEKISTDQFVYMTSD
ncbi:MAG: sodium:proton antiporter [Bombilactobacillus mellis]|nr:sodium:proton antiporter [Bombilactobacillus mellis]